MERYCPNCGAEIDEDTKLCPNCRVAIGGPIGEAWPPKPTAPEPPPGVRPFKLATGSPVGDFLLSYIPVVLLSWLWGAGIVLGVIFLVKAQEYKYVHNGAKWGLLTLLTLFLGMLAVCVVILQIESRH